MQGVVQLSCTEGYENTILYAQYVYQPQQVQMGRGRTNKLVCCWQTAILPVLVHFDRGQITSTALSI